jgi:hypothetical protein
MNTAMKIIGYFFIMAFLVPFLPVALGVYVLLYHDFPDVDVDNPVVGIGYISFLFVLSVIWLQFLIQLANWITG